MNDAMERLTREQHASRHRSRDTVTIGETLDAVRRLEARGEVATPMRVVQEVMALRAASAG